MSAGTYMLAGVPWLIAAVIAVTKVYAARTARSRTTVPSWPTVDRDPAPMPPLAAGTSPGPAASGPPHRTHYDLGRLMPAPERVW